jgi:hypothetical protein
MTSNELTEKLARILADLESGKLKPATAVEMNNAAGKIISNTKNQLLFCAMQGERPKIAFLNDCTTGEPSELLLMKKAKLLNP